MSSLESLMINLEKVYYQNTSKDDLDHQNSDHQDLEQILNGRDHEFQNLVLELFTAFSSSILSQ